MGRTGATSQPTAYSAIRQREPERDRRVLMKYTHSSDYRQLLLKSIDFT